MSGEPFLISKNWMTLGGSRLLNVIKVPNGKAETKKCTINTLIDAHISVFIHLQTRNEKKKTAINCVQVTGSKVLILLIMSPLDQH